MEVFDGIKAALQKNRKYIPVVALAELLVSMEEAEAKLETVVKKLEEEREYSYADFEEYVSEISPCLDAEYDDCFHRGLERAIKIVRNGWRK